jgi:hypothetical protein
MHKSPKFSTSAMEIQWVIIERNTHSNKTFLHSMAFAHLEKTTLAYTYYHATQINTSTISTPTTIIRQYMELQEHS